MSSGKSKDGDCFRYFSTWWGGIMSLYVDGCSFVYGAGLPRELSLAALLNADIDKSESGKSNIAIMEDLYSNIEMYDTFVIGFSFSARYTFKKHSKRQHLNPNRYVSNFGNYSSAELDEKLFSELNKMFYYFSDLEDLDLRSDYYVDSAFNLIEKHNKKAIFFSWEKRNIKRTDLWYPEFCNDMTLSDGHLNEYGMKQLCNRIKSLM